MTPEYFTMNLEAGDRVAYTGKIYGIKMLSGVMSAEEIAEYHRKEMRKIKKEDVVWYTAPDPGPDPIGKKDFVINNVASKRIWLQYNGTDWDIVEDKEEDHEGQVYNEYTGKWSWF